MEKILFLFITLLISCNSLKTINQDSTIFNINKPLEEISNNDHEIFRLISINLMIVDNEVIIIEKKNNSFFISSAEINFKNKLKNKKTRKLTNLQYENFIKKLKELNFENLEGYKSNNVDDGIEYRFQYYYNGKYNVITRNNPQTGRGYDGIFLQIINLIYSLKK